MIKRISVFVTLMSLCLVAFSQQSEDRKTGSFTAIRSSEGIDVYLKKGTKESIRVKADDIDIEDVITEVSDGTLKIHLKGSNHYRADVTVYVTFVKINDLSASSGSTIIVEDLVEATNLELSSSSAGNIEVKVKAERVKVNCSSAGEVEVSGNTNFLEASSSSAGEVDAYDLDASKVEAKASSGGSVKVNAIKEIDAYASSGGEVRYRGTPDKSSTGSSSGGSIKKSND